MRAQGKPGALGSRLLGNYEDNAAVLLLMLEILHDLNILQYLNPQGTRYPRPQTLNLRVMHNLLVSTVALIKKAFMLRSTAVGFSPSLGPDSFILFYSLLIAKIMVLESLHTCGIASRIRYLGKRGDSDSWKPPIPNLVVNSLHMQYDKTSLQP